MKLMAIDGNSLINRAFYGVRLLTTKDGLYTNAVFGFLNTYLKLLEDEKPDAVCVCFDLKGKTFRHESYDGYKAQRKGMPEELAVQMPYIKEALDALGVSRLELSGYEADDLLGTLSKKCTENGDTCVVITGDKDSLQLICTGVSVSLVSTRLGQTTTKSYDEQAFKNDYSGLMPEKIIDLKAIMGDKSDNIPGVSGIGEKGAMDLVLKFGSLDGVYENIENDNITKSMQKKLIDGREMAYLSYKLATIDKDAPINIDLNKFILQSVDNDQKEIVQALFTKLELFSILKKLDLKKSAESIVKIEHKIPEFTLINNALEITKLWQKIPKDQNISLYVSSDCDCIALCFGDSIVIVTKSNLKAEYGDFLAKLFSSEYKKIMHDAKSVVLHLLKYDIHAENIVFDTAIAQYLMSPADANYPLEKAVFQNFGVQIVEENDESNKQTALFDETSDDYSIYAKKAYYIIKLYEIFEKQLEELGMHELFYNIEMPLMYVLADMEYVGMKLNTEELLKFSDTLTEKISTITKEIYDIAGEEFNISSPKQLGVILYDKLGLKGGKKTANGYSTDADSLKRLAGKHEIIEKISIYRGVAKLKSTYCDGLLKVVGADTRIHTTFNQLVTATGRLSSTEPNMQNIPIRTDEGANIRRCFEAADGCELVDGDYSQIELRVLAHIANDENMLKAFEDGLDVHTATAAQVFGVELGDVTQIMRRRAKAVNFGIVYGISAFSLAEDIGVFVSEAQSYIDKYLSVYSGIKSYMENIKKQAAADKSVTTMFGRRRNLPEIVSPNFNVRAANERIALNTPIQGAAADIIKIAMVNVNRALKAEKMQTKLILQVHDELILEAPISEIDRAKKLLKENMEKSAELKVKLLVDVHTGKNWYEAK